MSKNRVMLILGITCISYSLCAKTYDHLGENLIIAARHGEIDKIGDLLYKGADANTKWPWTIRQGVAPLHVAVLQGHDDVVQVLVDNRADVNVAGPWGETPLHYAAAGGSFSILIILLRGGACVNVYDEWEYTPLYNAAKGGHKKIVKMLIHEGAHAGEALVSAVINDSIDTVKIFIDCGVDVNSTDHSGWSPLYWAETGEIAEILIESGADVNRANKRGDKRTPLHHAAMYAYDDVVSVLLDYGADVNVRDEWKTTPLHDAAQCGNRDVVEILLVNGADPNVRDRLSRYTPLRYAEENGHEEVVELLKEYGAEK